MASSSHLCLRRLRDRLPDPPSPQLFSFNSPQGMCSSCDGLGIRHDFAPELLVPNPKRCRSGTGRSLPLGPVKEIGRWAPASLRGTRGQSRRPTADGPPKGAVLRGPWLQTSMRNHGAVRGYTVLVKAGSSSTAGRAGAKSGRTSREMGGRGQRASQPERIVRLGRPCLGSAARAVHGVA